MGARAAAQAFVSREFGAPKIDLMHVNCEGCEWELLESLLTAGMTSQICTLQLGTHWFKQITDIEHRYCTIDSKLQATHTVVFKQAFGWERWSRKRG